MDDRHEHDVRQWGIALQADGCRATWIRDRCAYVRAIARHADKPAAEITETDVSRYAEARGIKDSSARHYHNAVNAFARFIATGTTKGGNGRSSRTCRIGDMDAYSKWLQAGKYRTATQSARRMSPGGAKAYANHISSLASQFGIHPSRITARHVEGWLDTHTDRSATYKNRCLRSLRYYAQFAGIADPTEDVRRFSEQWQEPKPRPAAPECVGALLTSEDDYVRAMTVLGASAGLRRHEIAKVCAEDFARRNGRWRLTVTGKGAKTRVIVMGDRAIARMAPVFVPGQTKGRLFPHLSDDPITGGEQVGDALQAAAAAAGHAMTAHQLRHYAATTLYDQTRDLEAVRRILGHSSIDTTMKYVQAWNDEQANASADALDSVLDSLAA